MADLVPFTPEELASLRERLLAAIELPGAAVYDFECDHLLAQVAAAEQEVARLRAYVEAALDECASECWYDIEPLLRAALAPEAPQ